jgi:hypothetical protein
MPQLAAYNYDEASGDFLDASGNGRHWTPNNNAVRTASGHANGGLTKGGTGLPVIATPAFNLVNAGTFMFWMRGAGTAVWWFRQYVAAADTGAFGLYLLGGNLTVRLRKGGANTNTAVAWTDDGLWHHYAVTYDGTNARLYRDAVLVATSAAVAAPLDAADHTDCMESGNNTQTMDDLRVYDEVLSQAQISTLMNTPVTSGPAPSEGVLNGTLPSPAAALAGQALTGGALAGTLPTPTGALGAEAVGSGLLAAQLPMPLAGLAGSALAAGTLGGALPVPVGMFSGYAQVAGGGQFTIMLPAMISTTGRVRQMKEQNQQRRVTREFIMASPTEVTLVPNTETRTGSGATKMDEGVPRPVQTFRLIPMSHTERPQRSLSDTGGGVQRKYDFTLLGEWDAVVSENDYFYGPDGEKYIVDSVLPFNGYERKAMVMAYGRRARHG